jgi:hypothetical protein
VTERAREDAAADIFTPAARLNADEPSGLA